MPNSLPRLLYLSAVPPERSFHGSLLLFRLLERYPADKLLVIESNLFPSSHERRLPGVRYETLREGMRRPLRTRFARFYRSWLTATAASRTGRIQSLVRDFGPQAVLTIPFYFSWITAARYAGQNGLPLHLILHDEYVDAPFELEILKPWLRRVFGGIYRSASTRLCVSPYMAQEYKDKYRAGGEVLYPSRAFGDTVFNSLPERLVCAKDESPLAVAFGGTVNTHGAAQLLAMVAQALRPGNGLLNVYGPMNPANAKACRLDAGNVVFKGSLDPESFKQALRREADVLLVPMTFGAKDSVNSRISFPSKLVDYTSVGLPLLIVGPESCSAVRWARENAPVAEVVTRPEPGDIAAALAKLRHAGHRVQLARAALEKGGEFFSHARAEKEFFNHLSGACSSGSCPSADAGRN